MGRRPFTYRRAVVGRSTAEVIDGLQGREPRRAFTSQATAGTRPVAFLFPGQGSQYVNMGLDLYRDEALFRDIVDECANRLLPDVGFDLRAVLYPPAGADAEAAAARLRETATTQSALFVTEYALARLWMSWGVVPTALVGHSIGELVAAAVSGVLALPDALRLVALRGRLMEAMPRGVMLAVPVEERRLAPMLGEGLWLAAVNAPGLCVASGDAASIDALAERLRRDGVEGRRLHTSHAFHSGLMDAAVDPFVAAAATMEIGTPSIPYLSNVTGTWITGADLRDPGYWGRHIRQAVRFSDNLQALLEDDKRALVEVGPGNTLGALVRQQSRGPAAHVVLSSLRHPQEQTTDATTMATALARLWVSGAAADWQGYHAGERRHRVSLPTYPFERKRYWVEPERMTVLKVKRCTRRIERRDLADWFHVPAWTRTLTPRLPADPAGGTALLFVDAAGRARPLADRLESLGYAVVSVEEGDGFSSAGERSFRLASGSRADYVALVRALRDRDLLPDVVAHCWTLTGRHDPMPSDVAIREYQDRGFYSLMHLAQAFGDIGYSRPLRLSVVTDGVHEVTGSEPLVPEKATLLGPARVIPQEFLTTKTRVIDLHLDDQAAFAGDRLDALAADLLSPAHERDVAYRAGRRWLQGYTSLHLAEPVAASRVQLRRRGTYLITGGLGDIGLVIAQHLASEFGARLVLTGRRGLPPRDAWAGHLAASGAKDATSRRIRAVEALEAAGAEVLVGEADVTDEAAMRRVVDEAIARFGRIDGVIHSAGIAGGGMIQLKTREVAASVLAPKVVGARVLARIFEGRQPDFLVLCSSLTAVLAGLGQVDYCGANASLDAFARQYATSTGVRAISINWNAWREVGMAVDTAVPEDLKDAIKTQMLASGISNADGVEAFKRILSVGGEHQVAVFPFDLQLTVETAGITEEDERQERVVPTNASSASAAAPASALHARPNLSTAYVAPRTDAERKVAAVWGELLGIDRVGVEDSFFDLGGHSLLAIRVMAKVNEALKTDLPVARLYEGLTVAFVAGLAGAAVGTNGDGEAEPDADEDQDQRRRERAQRLRDQQRRRVATRK